MDTIMSILLIIIVVSLLLFIYALIYNQYQNYSIKTNEVESSIDNVLRCKFDVLSKVKTGKNKNDIAEALEQLKEEKLSTFELDRKLTTIENNYYQKVKNDKKTIRNDVTKKICMELEELSERLLAYTKYYNDNITKYNKMVRMFPTNIVSILSHFKEKPFFDGKDLTDEDINDVKL